MKFNPPFLSFKFGLIKEYSFLENPIQIKNDEHSAHPSIVKLIINTFDHKDVFVIGHYDGFLSFYRIQTDVASPIFAYCKSNSKEKLTKVADNINTIYKIVADIKQFREQFPWVEFLPKNERTLSEMKRIMNDFNSYSPNSYGRFWQEHAMGELMIGLEL